MFLPIAIKMFSKPYPARSLMKISTLCILPPAVVYRLPGRFKMFIINLVEH